MKHNFNCPNCRARLRADEAYVGRKISCPKCGVELVIPQIDSEQASSDASFAGKLLETNASDCSRVPSDATTTLLHSDSSNGGGDDFDLATDVGFLPPAKFDPPPPDPDDPMLVLFPDFIPNPFQISFHLDQIIEGEDDGNEEEGEEDAPVNSKMPSVDELIN